jgi:hypothetical protein
MMTYTAPTWTFISKSKMKLLQAVQNRADMIEIHGLIK